MQLKLLNYMETKIRKFIRNTPEDNLKAFLINFDLNLPEDFKWHSKNKNYFNDLFTSIWDCNDNQKQDLFDGIERIHNMNDELGQNALCAVVASNDNFLNLKGEYARTIWVYTNHPEKFKIAEYHASHDYKRKSKEWNAFVGPKNREIHKSDENISTFKEEVLQHLDISRKLQVEFCDRIKTDNLGNEIKICSLVAFHDGLPKSLQTFDKDNLVTQHISPAKELSISYDPESGIIEAISDSKDNRAFLAKIFANVFLKTSDDVCEIKLKKYDLSKFYSYCDLMKDVDIEDMISDIKVTSLKLRPVNDKNSTIIESPFTEKRTIYEIAEDWYAENNPLKNSFEIKKVRLSIKFKPDDKNPRGKLIHINITDPNGCDLKDRTEKEKLIGSKYLKRWGILEKI